MHPLNCFTPGMFNPSFPTNGFPINPFAFTSPSNLWSNPLAPQFSQPFFGGPIGQPFGVSPFSSFPNTLPFGGLPGLGTIPTSNFSNPYASLNTVNPFGAINPFNTINPFFPTNTLTPSPFNNPYAQLNNPFSQIAPWGFNPLTQFGLAGVPTGQFPGVQPYATVPGGSTQFVPTTSVNGQPIPVAPGARLNGVPTPVINGIPTGPISGQPGFVNPVSGQPVLPNPAFNFFPGYNPLATINPFFGAPNFGYPVNPMSYGFNPLNPWTGMPYAGFSPMPGYIPVPTGYVGQPTLCREAA